MLTYVRPCDTIGSTVSDDATNDPAEPRVLWEPPANVRETTRIGAYLRWLEEAKGRHFATYQDLWQWSVDDLDGFWASIWEYFQIRSHTPYTEVLGNRTMPGATWFTGATLNYAEHVLLPSGVGADDVLVVARSQSREPVELTLAELRDQVARARAGLRRLGVGRGDRVAAYLPNVPETVVLFLASASLGAVFSSCAPEFGTRSVVDRWQQIEPKVLVAVDGYRYGAKDIDRTTELAQIRAALPSLAHAVVLPYLTAEPDVPDALTWQELLAEPGELAFDPMPFDHPLYVLYSSGTTGLPKPIVHCHGGILVEHLKKLAFHDDLGPGSRFFWFSTTGWMMWNYLVSGLLVGATILLYDGNPGYPDLGELWRFAEETEMTFFGTSAPYLMACRKEGLQPRATADLSRLRGVGSTGAPLPVEGFRWVYENVADPEGPGLLLNSTSGGTDVCTAFVGSVPLLPVREGEIPCRCLAAKVEAYDEAGRPVIGREGELVLTAPMPSMPVGFWGDDDGSRYRAAYFDTFPGVWRHGDWVTVDEHGRCVITGRSDATLNRGGVRLGTSEFYAVVESLPEVADSLVVHLDDPDDPSGRLLLFLVLREGKSLGDELRRRIAGELRTSLSPRHVPDAMHQVSDVPRTLSGKKLEVPVKRILTGAPVETAAAKGALANPDALAEFEGFGQSVTQ
ncbi:MAG: acetoacetate--CoA ligase [Streptosporangiales bacterium]|nr:acetoacetate--CoA ligase [Streptosporangiales bacterium]